MTRLLFLCVISATTHLCESRSSHCSAGIFTAGKDAFVDCDFNADVSISNHHIFVTWSPSNINNKEKDVLTCWTHHNNESSCKLAEGYYYEGGISDHLKLLIPDVTPQFSGVYSCKLSMDNYSLSDFAACSLTVKEPEDTKPCSDFSSYTIFMAYQSILLTFTCILVISLAVKTFWNCRYQCKRRLACCRHRRGDTTHNSSSTSRKELEMQKRPSAPLYSPIMKELKTFKRPSAPLYSPITKELETFKRPSAPLYSPIMKELKTFKPSWVSEPSLVSEGSEKYEAEKDLALKPQAAEHVDACRTQEEEGEGVTGSEKYEAEKDLIRFELAQTREVAEEDKDESDIM